METSLPSTMKAAAIDRFGGPELLRVRNLPVPVPMPDDVLIRLETAGIGVWDPLVREGALSFGTAAFPFVIGNDGAGTVVSTGPKASRFRVGDRVYACSLAGGFYAEYAAVHQDTVAPLPTGLKLDEAGAFGADGVTAFRGLADQLRLRSGEKIIIYGASGGVGHIAVQFAKRMGAVVFAVASGRDGVAFVKEIGADGAADGKGTGVAAEAKKLAPTGYDTALVLANGPTLNEVLALLNRGGRITHPNGVEPVPQAPEGVALTAYDATMDREVFDRMNRLIGTEPFRVHLWKTYSLEEAERAHREVKEHHFGKAAFRM